jgi:hypothetical protein
VSPSLLARRVGLAALALLMVPSTASAQGGARVSVSGVVGYAGSATVVQGVAEQGSGVWYGVRADLRIGRLAIEVSGLRGTLAPDDSAGGLRRDGGEMRGAVRLDVASWLALEGGYAVRAFDSPLGYQKWTIPAVGARISADLGMSGLRGYVRGSYLPSASSPGLPSSSLGLAAEAGLRLEPRSGGLTLGVFYRLERFDFGSAPDGRLEQFDLLGVSLGLSLGRR